MKDTLKSDKLRKKFFACSTLRQAIEVIMTTTGLNQLGDVTVIGPKNKVAVTCVRDYQGCWLLHVRTVSGERLALCKIGQKSIIIEMRAGFLLSDYNDKW